MRRWTTAGLGAMVVLAALAVRGFGEGDVEANRPQASGADAPRAQRAEAAQDRGYIMHEWGTFTTFSGSDGVHLEYRPLDTRFQDLPEFVFDRVKQSGQPFFSKTRLRARVRMETPVIYFYTDRVRQVRVRVEFPEGLLTEFYPPVREMAPKFDSKTALTEGEPIGNSFLDWGEVDLIPASAFRPAVENQETAQWLQQLTLASILPPDFHNHYQHARHTESALVHLNLPATATTAPRGRFLEKFLFYRGVGKLKLPVEVRFEGDQPQVVNGGQQPLRSMMLLEVRGEMMRMATLPSLEAGQAAPLPQLTPIDRPAVMSRVVEALVEEGLFEAEARAMVRTWQDSWFAEEGLRMLYMVPEQVTERLLPLQLEPAPAESLRVLVGRLEILSPQEEQAILDLVADHAEARARHAEQAEAIRAAQGDAAEVPALPLPQGLLDMGRFAEPALARVIAITSDRGLQAEAQRLIDELRAL